MHLEIPEPWFGFLREIDEQLDDETHLHCYGGFVVAMCYGLERPTNDVDFLAVVPSDAKERLLALAGRESALHEKHRVYLEYFGMVDYPDGYQERLTEMFPGVLKRLHLWALDPYDLALSKLQRNGPRDREDVRFLADAVPLNLATLKDRYESEMRPYLANPAREDLTLQLWIDDVEELREKKRQR